MSRLPKPHLLNAYHVELKLKQHCQELPYAVPTTSVLGFPRRNHFVFLEFRSTQYTKTMDITLLRWSWVFNRDCCSFIGFCHVSSHVYHDISVEYSNVLPGKWYLKHFFLALCLSNLLLVFHVRSSRYIYFSPSSLRICISNIFCKLSSDISSSR